MLRNSREFFTYTPLIHEGDLQRRQPGARLGDAHADTNAKALGRLIDLGEQVVAEEGRLGALGADDRARPKSRQRGVGDLAAQLRKEDCGDSHILLNIYKRLHDPSPAGAAMAILGDLDRPPEFPSAAIDFQTERRRPREPFGDETIAPKEHERPGRLGRHREPTQGAVIDAGARPTAHRTSRAQKRMDINDHRCKDRTFCNFRRDTPKLFPGGCNHQTPGEIESERRQSRPVEIPFGGDPRNQGARPFATASKFHGGGVARDGGPTLTGAPNIAGGGVARDDLLGRHQGRDRDRRRATGGPDGAEFDQRPGREAAIGQEFIEAP